MSIFGPGRPECNQFAEVRRAKERPAPRCFGQDNNIRRSAQYSEAKYVAISLEANDLD